MAASLSMFPSELIRNIVDHLDDMNDIASLALVCRATYPAADCELYRRASKLKYLLCWASEFGKTNMVRRLLDAGADATKPWRNGSEIWEWDIIDDFSHPLDEKDLNHSPIQMLHQYYGHPQRMRATPHNKSDIERPLSISSPADHDPSEDQDLTEKFESSFDIMDKHVNHNLNLPYLTLDRPHSRDEKERWPCLWFPLHLAAMSGHVEIADLLLQHGVDLNERAQGICRCVHETIRGRNWRKSYQSSCEFWRSEDNLLERWPLDGYVIATPLHVALCHQQQDMAIMLLQRGAAHSFGIPQWGAHIIHTAAAHGCLDVLKFLLSGICGTVDINIQDSRGLTPLYYAYLMRQQETILWLLENKADIEVELGAGLTLLHLACLDGAFDMASLLIDAGADVNHPWAESICPYLGQLRPLEICCALHPTKAHCTYAKFEPRKLELMKRLLDAGASVGPITQARTWLNRYIPIIQFSAVTIAAAHHSVPMLELLCTSSDADFTREGSAIHEAINPNFIHWKSMCDRDPLPVLHWLVAHGVPVEQGTPKTVDAVAFVCAQPTGTPWKGSVLEWLVNYPITPHTELVVVQQARKSQRIHPMDVVPSCSWQKRSSARNSTEQRYYRTTPFWEALRISDFPACKSLLYCDPRLDLVEAFQDLLKRVEENRIPPGEWPDTSREGVLKDQDRNYQYQAQLEFLLKVDNHEFIKRRPETLLSLLSACNLHPSRLLLDTTLPTKNTIQARDYISHNSLALKVANLYDLRHRHDPTNNQRDWDLAIRLAIAISSYNWNAAHFLLQEGAETSWAHEEGMEYFALALSALNMAPSPDIIGHDTYRELLIRWDWRQSWSKTDVLTSLFFEACNGPIDLAPFLTDRAVDINAVDAYGCTALSELVTSLNLLELFPRIKGYQQSGQLLQLLRAGADPRVTDNKGRSVMDTFRETYQNPWKMPINIAWLDEDEESGRVEIHLRLDEHLRSGKVDPVERFVFDGPVPNSLDLEDRLE